MRTVLVHLPLLLTDCAAQRALEAQEAKTKLVGMSDERILACMGPPQNRSALGGTEVWQYSSGNGHMDAHEFGTASVTGGTGFVNTNASVSSRFCTINVAMSNHVVQAVNYSGPTGGLLTEGEQCALAVKACLGQ